MPQARKKRSSEASSQLPDLIFAQASPRSIGGTSLFGAGAAVTSSNVTAFFSEAEIIQNAVMRLLDARFQVLQVTATTINIAGPAAAYEQVFGTKLVSEERPLLLDDGSETSTSRITPRDGTLPGLIDTSGSAFSDVLEGVAIEEKVIYFESAFPPPAKYWHLDVPADVSLAVNAEQAHRAGTIGSAVNVVMVDTGWYRHPYFTQRGYRSSPVVLAPGAASPDDDEHGHGTGESANVFAAAPDVQFTMVKQSPVNATASFNAAVGLAPHVISCSWGFDIENGPLSAAHQALAAAVATAVAAGIVVVFSAGNGHYGFPGAHPDVISAGGVFMNPDGSTRASDYASGFASKVYPSRNVPDVCGLVGLSPGAKYIMLPVQPGDVIDTTGAGGTHPSGDETANNDGWAAFSGTSAAAPQLAGVCALLKQACAQLTPAEIKDILKKTARDVTTGTCSAREGMGTAATVGPDLATGHGLVDAQKAVLMAKVRCLRPTQPIEPTRPIQPVAPIQPIQPIRAIEPIQPTEPVQAVGPLGPGPLAAEAGAGRQRLSDEDIAALEDLIVRGEGDIGL